MYTVPVDRAPEVGGLKSSQLNQMFTQFCEEQVFAVSVRYFLDTVIFLIGFINILIPNQF